MNKKTKQPIIVPPPNIWVMYKQWHSTDSWILAKCIGWHIWGGKGTVFTTDYSVKMDDEICFTMYGNSFLPYYVRDRSSGLMCSRQDPPMAYLSFGAPTGKAKWEAAPLAVAEWAEAVVAESLQARAEEMPLSIQHQCEIVIKNLKGKTK